MPTPSPIDVVLGLAEGEEAIDAIDEASGSMTQGHMIVGLVRKVSANTDAALLRPAIPVGDDTQDVFDLMPEGSVADPKDLNVFGPASVPGPTWQAIRFALDDKDPDRNSTADISAGFLAILKRIKASREPGKADVQAVSFQLLEELNMRPTEKHRANAFHYLSLVLRQFGVPISEVFSMIAQI